TGGCSVGGEGDGWAATALVAFLLAGCLSSQREGRRSSQRERERAQMQIPPAFIEIARGFLYMWLLNWRFLQCPEVAAMPPSPPVLLWPGRPPPGEVDEARAPPRSSARSSRGP